MYGRALIAVVVVALFSANADAQIFRRWVQSRQEARQAGPVMVQPAAVQTGVVLRSPIVRAPVVSGVTPVSCPDGVCFESVLAPAVSMPAKPMPAKPARQTGSGLFGLESLELERSAAAAIPEHVLAQVDEPTEAPLPVAESFRETLAAAIGQARKSGKINFREWLKLRVAMRSPAFVQAAQELAVVQVAFSGEESDDVPFDETGAVQADGINWEGLAKFLEAFVPLLISLLKAFGL